MGRYMKISLFATLTLLLIFSGAARADLQRPEEKVPEAAVPAVSDYPDYYAIKDSITIDPHDTFDGTPKARLRAAIEEITDRTGNDPRSADIFSPTMIFLYVVQMVSQYMIMRQLNRNPGTPGFKIFLLAAPIVLCEYAHLQSFTSSAVGLGAQFMGAFLFLLMEEFGHRGILLAEAAAGLLIAMAPQAIEVIQTILLQPNFTLLVEAAARPLIERIPQVIETIQAALMRP